MLQFNRTHFKSVAVIVKKKKANPISCAHDFVSELVRRKTLEHIPFESIAFEENI